VSKSFPGGEQNFAFEFPVRKFLPVIHTSDEEFLVGLGLEKLKPHLYVHSNKTGALLHKILLKYTGYKVFLATEHFLQTFLAKPQMIYEGFLLLFLPYLNFISSETVFLYS
jgi:hypothetical protein